MFEPDFGALGVGKVLFIEDFEFGFAFGKLGKQGVFAGGGHSCVQHFDHHVDALGAFGDGFFCFVHVAGKPLDCHVLFFLSDLRWGRLKSGSAVFSDDLRFVRFLCKGRLKAYAVFQTTFLFGAIRFRGCRVRSGSSRLRPYIVQGIWIRVRVWRRVALVICKR